MSHAAITLRPALARDSHAIALMSREHIEYGLAWKYDAARIRRALERSNGSLLAAFDRGSLVGFAMMGFGDERAHLVLMAVRPTHRRRGIGRRLLPALPPPSRHPPARRRAPRASVAPGPARGGGPQPARPPAPRPAPPAETGGQEAPL